MDEKDYAATALCFSLGGVVLAGAILVIVPAIGTGLAGEKSVWMLLLACSITFLVFQLAALVPAIFAWHSVAGKVACIISGILTACALWTLFLLLA